MRVVIYGASDDLVEVDGAIREEFTYEEGGMLLAASDGTLLTIDYTGLGQWKISRVVAGLASCTITPANEQEEAYNVHGVEDKIPGYSDCAVLSTGAGTDTETPLKWIVVAPASAGKRP